MRTKWDFWSLGMMLVEMLTGRHPFAGLNDQIIGMRLSTGNVDQLVEGVGDAAWRKLCRGLLRRDPRQRWGKAEIDRWLLNPRDPKLVVAEEIALGRPGFAFMGNDYRSKEDLAANFARNWDVAKGIWQSRNKQLRDWLMHDLGHSDVVNQLERIDKTPGLDLDAQLFSVIHILDPQAPLSFRGLELTEAKLTMLADRSPNDTMAGELLRALFRSRILHLFEKLPNGDKIATIGKAWQEAVGEYERLRYEISSADYTAHVPALDDERLTILLAATTSRNVVIESLRTRARVASTPDAHECKWFEILGNPETAQSAALLHMAISGVAAAEHTKSRRAREVQQAAERRRLEAEAAAARREDTRKQFMQPTCLALGIVTAVLCVPLAARATAAYYNWGTCGQIGGFRELPHDLCKTKPFFLLLYLFGGHGGLADAALGLISLPIFVIMYFLGWIVTFGGVLLAGGVVGAAIGWIGWKAYRSR